jgi:hypothetical protein
MDFGVRMVRLAWLELRNISDGFNNHYQPHVRSGL